MEEAELYFDGDLELLKEKTIGVIGYGNQGRAQAKILRENGMEVIIGNIRDPAWDRAVRDGFEVYEIEDASERSDLILMLIPDEVAPDIYHEKIVPAVKDKRHIILDFASGYNITYRFIEPLPNMDVIMVAPRMIGWGILDVHKAGKGFPVLLGVAQDSSGMAWEYARALAKGIGAIGLPGGVAVKSSFEEETLLDLLTEHVTAPLLIAAVQAYFDVVTKQYGISPEAAILELYASGELAESAKLMAEMGFFEQLVYHSRTSQYGQLTRANRFYPMVKEMVEKEARDIWSGEFAREYSLDKISGYTVLKRMWSLARASDLSKAEDKLYKALGRRH